MDANVIRQAAYFDAAGQSFFGWYHDAPDAPARDLVAVVCGPIGSEYTRSHRSLRHLADRLSRAGIPALRFDYHGTGNSPGTDLDPGRVEAWLGTIAAACAHARKISGRSRVCLLGVRLGGTLAALASREIAPDLLVLWNAPAKGKAYVRELQAIAATAARASESDDALEAAGGMLTRETLDHLRAIDLLQQSPRAGRVLLVNRDDLPAAPALEEALVAAGIPCESVALPGWNGMMADHQFTVVPDAALAAIVDWVGNWCQTRSPETAPIISGSDMANVSDTSFEEICRFGEDQQLFGILTRPSKDAGQPAILLFNGGAVHHVGPNRVYVTLARHLAALGFAVLRFDLEGIGDSVMRAAGRENQPYPPHATADARAALEYLRARHGYRRFVAMGLCSGAHTAFHAGLALDDPGLEELVLINPLAFYWHEGLGIESVSRMHDAVQYKNSMRDPGRWLKLLRGDVNFKRLFEVALHQPKVVAKSYLDAVVETVAPHRAPRLSQDLRRLFGMNRRVTVLVSEGDPGRDIIMSEAKLTAQRALARGQMRLETIAGGDHTFTQSRPRRALLERVAANLGARP